MRMFRRAMGGVAIATLTIALAVAQPVTQNTLSGSECWSAGQGPGGPSTFICANLLRNTVGMFLTPGAATLQLTPAQSSVIFTAQPPTMTITLPASPVPDGMMVELVNGTAAAFATNVLTVTVGGSQTLIGGNILLTTLAAGTSREIRYSLGTNTWYPAR